MRFGSVCSGIESASVAWESLGWSAAWFAEIEAFPSAVLAHHFPHVMNVGDMTNIAYLVSNRFIEAPDVLVGGTPCQAFSVAGSRKSLDDDRGQLSLEYCKILDAIDGVKDEKCIAVWENVPGVLSTPDNAFGCFLGELAGAGEELKPTGKKWTNSGYIIGPKRQVAWRILDAQFFGVAQRRRRVFVVASARDGFNPSEVLFEFDGLRRDTPPSRSPGENASGGVKNGFASSSFTQYREITNDAGVLKASGGDLGRGSENLVVHGIQGSMIGRSNTAGPQGSGVSDDLSFTLTKGDRHAVSVVHGTQDPIVANDNAFPLGRNNGQENAVLFEPRSADGVPRLPPDQTLVPTLNTMSGGQREPCVSLHGAVRRLTPVECERLMGFPDNWTKIPCRGKDADACPDGPRYAACGNSMVVHVMHWIGWRIDNYVTNK